MLYFVPSLRLLGCLLAAYLNNGFFTLIQRFSSYNVLSIASLTQRSFDCQSDTTFLRLPVWLSLKALANLLQFLFLSLMCQRLMCLYTVEEKLGHLNLTRLLLQLTRLLLRLLQERSLRKLIDILWNERETFFDILWNESDTFFEKMNKLDIFVLKSLIESNIYSSEYIFEILNTNESLNFFEWMNTSLETVFETL